MQNVKQILDLLHVGKHDQAMKLVNDVIKNGLDDEKFILAEELFQLGFLDEAQQLFSDLLSAYPDEGELIVLLAETFMEKGQEDEAILLLEKVRSTDDVYPQSLLLLADLYQMEGLYEVSEQKLLVAKNMLPTEVTIDFALGELFAEQGKFNEAIATYKNVLKEKTTIAGVNVNQRMAELLSASGLFEDALPYFEKALEEKLEINTLFGYGFTALQAGHHKLAIRKLTELKELDHEYHSVYLLLAKAYEREEQLEASLETVQDGLAIDSFNKELYFYGGKISLKLGKEMKALKLLREAIALDPGYSEAVITLNKVLLSREEYEELIELMDEVKTYGEEDPQYFWDRAVAYQHLEQYSQALNEYEHAYTFFKDNQNFLHSYGYFLIEEGKLKEAGKIFNKLLSQDPSNEEYIEVIERIVGDPI